jgi:hypothetical protein
VYKKVVTELKLLIQNSFHKRNQIPLIFIGLLLCALIVIRIIGNAEFGYGFSKYAGYWLCASLFFALCYSAFQLCNCHSSVIKAYLLKNGYWLGFTFILSIFWLVHEPWIDRVLYDEYVYKGIAYMMHTNREALNPARAHLIDGNLRIFDSIPDKRSYLFPYFVSLIHDLTGLRAKNVFYFNYAVGIFILPTAFITIKQFFCTKTALISTLFLFSFGLIPVHANSSGYEILNLLFIQLWLLFAFLTAKHSDYKLFDVFCIISISVALIRNESVFYLLGTFLIVIVKSTRGHIINLTWPVILSSVSLSIPVVANLNFNTIDGLRENVLGQNFFSLEYFTKNFISSVYFLFNVSPIRPNSPALALAGVIGIIFYAVKYVKTQLLGHLMEVSATVISIFGCCLALSYILFMCSFWGDWNDPMVSRFSIPIHYGFTVFFAWFVNEMLKTKYKEVAYLFSLTSVVLIMVVNYPKKVNNIYTRSFQVGQEMEYVKKFLANRDTTKKLFLVTNGVSGFIPDGIPCTWITGFGLQSWRVQALIDNAFYDDLIIADRFTFDSATSSWQPDRMVNEPDEVSWYKSKKYEYELVGEYFSSVSSSVRIYKLLGTADPEKERNIVNDYTVKNGISRDDKTLYMLNFLP